MADWYLRKSYKNSLFRCIEEAGLSPATFEWLSELIPIGGYEKSVSVLIPENTSFYFKFYPDPDDSFTLIISPGVYALEENKRSHQWEGVVDQFKDWLSRVKQESLPDLWEQIPEYTPSESIVDRFHLSDELFSSAEAERVIGRLEELRSQIQDSFDLQGHRLEFVTRQIDYLKEAATRQKKNDWVHTAVGVMVTIAVGLALSPEKTKVLWNLLRSCFALALALPAP